MKGNFNLLTALRASHASALLMFVIACVLLGDQLMPFLITGDQSPLELTEVQEESESKKETEKEMEDSDEFLHCIQIHRFTSNVHLINLPGRLDLPSVRVAVSETPPPEFV